MTIKTKTLPIPVDQNDALNGGRIDWLVDVDVPVLSEQDAPIVAEWNDQGKIHSYRFHAGGLWMPMLPDQVVVPDDLLLFAKGALRKKDVDHKFRQSIRRHASLTCGLHASGYSSYRADYKTAIWNEVKETKAMEASKRLDERVVIVGDEVWTRSTGPVIQKDPVSGAIVIERSRKYDYLIYNRAMVFSAFRADEALETLRSPGKNDEFPIPEVRIESEAMIPDGEVLSESAEWALWSFLWEARTNRVQDSDKGYLETVIEVRNALINRWGDALELYPKFIPFLARHLPFATLPAPDDLIPALEMVMEHAVSRRGCWLASRMNTDLIRNWAARQDGLEALTGMEL